MNLIGLDIGTTSLCGILCDAETGEIRRSVSMPNDTFIDTVHPWEKQQDPVRLLDKLRAISNDLIASGDIAAIGVTGQMHGIVYLDKAGNPLGPLVIWQDGRGDQFYKDGQTYAEYLASLTGYPMATGYGAVTHFYNTVNGLVPPQAVTFCTIHDLAVMTLTGRTAPLLHPSDSASIGLYDLKNNCFDADAIRRAGMDPAFFPAVADSVDLAGKTPTDIPVSIAIGDNQASVLGSVSDFERSILVNVGTGSQISCVVSAIPENPTMDCRPLVRGRWILTGSSLCGGRAYAILEKFLRETAVIITGQMVDNAYPAMDKLMATFGMPDDPLTVDTRFSGTRRDPTLRGGITGIGIDNFTIGHLCDGFMNGMVEELYAMYRGMHPMLEQEPTRLVGSGNGLRFNKPLCERFSAAFGVPLSIPLHCEEAAFGAALFAAVTAGVFSSLTEAQKRIHYA